MTIPPQTSERPGRWSTRQWMLLIGIALAASVLKGIRFPNIWSYTHLLFNYDQGFVKRALLGELLQRSDNNWLTSYDFFSLASLIVFAANLYLMVKLLRGLATTQDTTARLGALLFASSLATTCLAHFIGYFDQLGLLLTLITLRIGSFRGKMVFLFATFPILLLIHEGMLLLFFPVVFMSAAFSIDKRRWGRSLAVLLIFSFSAVMVTAITAQSTLSETASQQMYTELDDSSELALREDAFRVLYRRSADNLLIMLRKWSDPARARDMLLSVLVTAPSLVLLLFCLVRQLRRRAQSPALIGLAVLASTSPLLLHAVAWDMNRFNSLAIVTAFLMLTIAHQIPSQEPEPEASVPEPRGRLHLAMLAVVLLNMNASIALYDDYEVRQFPFSEHIDYLWHLASGKERFPSPPD